MQRFDCLSPQFSLKGPHLLEASAGTGKTFAVEQIFVRLLLEKGFDVEQILVITFTRAATRELKERIRSNIEKALTQLSSDLVEWAYLLPFQRQKSAMQTLRDALGVFDRSQIFTIHGFCHRMLKEFAFEAKFCTSPARSDEPCVQIPEKMEQGVLDFLSSLSEDQISSEQLAILLKRYKGSEGLAKALLRVSLKELDPGISFKALYEEYAAACKPGEFPLEQVLQDFRSLSTNYKASVKGRFEEQIRALWNPPTPASFGFLLSEEGSLFDFLSPANRKVKYTPFSLVSEPFFTWGRVHIHPLLQKGSDDKQIFSSLAYEWSLCAQRLMNQEELFDPDAILQKMHKNLKNPSFLQLVQNKYAAGVIDEFQDTDLLQWDIFRTLFLDPGSLAQSVFLVGDPKQSIYRFRKADIYTYLQAKDYLDPSSHYCLDTNFRSSPALLSALNTLFQRDWLALPKLRSFLPYRPVFAGRKDPVVIADDKGALHFFVAEAAPSTRKSSFETLMESIFLPFMAKEIVHLKKEMASLSDLAVLVKDRYQAAQVVRYLQERGLPAVTKSHLPLGETFAFEALYELLTALINPKDRSKAKLVLAGPLARASSSEMPEEPPLLFFELKTLLEEKGLPSFFQTLFSSCLYKKTVLESIALESADFYRDFFHAIELLLEWERLEGFSLEGLARALDHIRSLETEEDEKVRRRLSSDDEAIQVMTMHVSKGLEFEIVFALGLAAGTPKPEDELEELEAEKLRQLYVAMTRAKRRLYVPAFTEGESLDAGGGASPIELFLHHVREGKSLKTVLEDLKRETSISWEMVNAETVEVSSQEVLPLVIASSSPCRYEIFLSHLHSFTSLARPMHVSTLMPLSGETLTVHTLPRGAEMGVLLHELLEDIFSSPYPLWRSSLERQSLIATKLKDSKFSLWTAVIQDLLSQVVSLPFLAELEPSDVKTEVEFIFEKPPHFIKGFIDLLFRQGDQLYFLDWKSNWLGENDEAYDEDALRQSMKENDYELQATLYAEALSRAFPAFTFKGAYYLFLRGIASATKGIFFLQPGGNYGILA
jgi:exodeoxyribonuclease V beta subunit